MDLDFRAVSIYNKISDFGGIFFRWIELLENCKLKNITV